MRKYINKYFLPLSFLMLTGVASVTMAQTAMPMETEMAEDGQFKSTPEGQYRASLKEDMVTGFFNRYWMPVNAREVDGYYRKLVKIEGNDRFLVQDFFTSTSQKQSDPVLINNIYELKQLGFLKSIEGPYVTWYQNGQKQYQAFYKSEGVFDGVMQAWYEDGTLKMKGSYDKGDKVGQWVEWHENGRMKLQANYDNGLLNGVYKKWYANGQQQTLGSYKAGRLNGLWTVWNGRGDKASEGEYVDDQREKKWTYYLDGKKWAEGSYVNNLQDGTWTYWDTNGVKNKEIIYQKGIKVRETVR